MVGPLLKLIGPNPRFNLINYRTVDVIQLDPFTMRLLGSRDANRSDSKWNHGEFRSGFDFDCMVLDPVPISKKQIC